MRARRSRPGAAVLGAGVLLAAVLPSATFGLSGQRSEAPVIVVETSRGMFAFETYPNDAPKTVAHIVDLVSQGFYDGQRVHRAVPGFVVQWGDPRSRDASQEADWGLGPGASSGHAIGVAEITRKRTHIEGAVGVAHPGLPAQADSQIYITLAVRSDLNGKYAVFGQVIEGMDVPPRLERGDVIRRMYVRDQPD